MNWVDGVPNIEKYCTSGNESTHHPNQNLRHPSLPNYITI